MSIFSGSVHIRSTLARLLTKNKAILTDVSQYARKNANGTPEGKLVDWKTNMSAAGLELKSGSVNIQQAATALTTQIEEYNGLIEQLRLSIQQYQKLIATGAGLVDGGVFVGILGVCASALSSRRWAVL